MIIITQVNGYQLKYKGRIEIYLSNDSSIVHVHAFRVDSDHDEFPIWRDQVYDALFINEIESIKGKEV